MTIEFHAPQGAVKEDVIAFIRDKLMKLHHLDKEIARAQVYLKKQPESFGAGFECDIDLTVYGDSIYVSRSGKTYLRAAEKVLDELSQKVAGQVKRQKEPPDELTSSIKV